MASRKTKSPRKGTTFLWCDGCCSWVSLRDTMHTCYDFVQSEYNTFFEIAKSKAGLTKKQKNIKVIKAVVSSVMRRYAGPGRRIYRDF